MIAAIDRGLTPSDVKKMDLGHVLDFCITYNKIHTIDDEEEKPKPKKRKASQGDWNSLFG